MRMPYHGMATQFIAFFIYKQKLNWGIVSFCVVNVRTPSQSNKMMQTKFMLFTTIALMVVGSAVAIVGGKDAARGQFSYFAYLEVYQSPKPVFFIQNSRPFF